MDPAAAFHLFVYGTLMRGGCRHHVLSGQPFLGAARTLPLYVLHHLGDYPGMVPGTQGRAVHGELYQVERALLPRLDHVEGAPTLFRLEEVLLEGGCRPALAYFFQKDVAGSPLCPDGRWLARGGRMP